MASPHRIPPETDAPSTPPTEAPNAAADAAVAKAEKVAQAAAQNGRLLSEKQADAAADAWLKSQGLAPMPSVPPTEIVTPRKKRVRRRPRANARDPNRRLHRKNETPRCAKP